MTEGSIQECGIIFPRRVGTPDDDVGCRLQRGHQGPHEFVTDSEIVRWETDMECNCEDCHSDDANDWCVLYTVDNIDETTNRIFKSQ